VADEQKFVRVPEELPLDTVASAFLKGLTARYLIKQTYVLKKNDWALVYAAAGATGQILAQWCVGLGANVIAVVSTPEKAEFCKTTLGVKHVILNAENIAERVKELTNQRGVDVVYDSIGKETFMASLDSVKRCGFVAS
jgi:NADPH2:quinone reductase